MIPDAYIRSLFLEVGLGFVALLFAIALPGTGHQWFSSVENWVARFARRRKLAVVFVGCIAPLIRLALLPVAPIPEPAVHDEFSYLLAADTFASGRLTNPTHPMWMHFETFHVSHRPTYMSIYFPAHGLLLAAGKLLFGHPWYAVCISVGIMCATLCWMLQGWVPPPWALLGGILAAFRIGISTYWMNGYWGGALAAIGGALILGALPRLVRHVRIWPALLLGFGVALLANCRPVELVLLAVGICVAGLCGKFRRKVGRLLHSRITLPIGIVISLTALGMGYYNWRVFGSPATLPYQLNRAEYAVSPMLLWQPRRPEPPYRHAVMRNYYVAAELPVFQAARSTRGFVSAALKKAGVLFVFFFGPLLMLALIMVGRVFRQETGRFLLIAAGVYFVGVLADTFVAPHYFAPATGLLYANLVYAYRQLRRWKPGGQAVGVTLVRVISPVFLALCAVQLTFEPLSPGAGLPRAEAQRRLESLPGKQLAIVRYGPHHRPLDVEWVYNKANIDAAKVVWAREMGTVQDRELIAYFKDRTPWLLEPDRSRPHISPYAPADPTMTRNLDPTPHETK